MNDVESFIADLGALASKYDELAEVTAKQTTVVDGGDLAPLELLVERKRAIMAEVEAISARTAEWRAEWETRVAAMDPEVRPRVEAARTGALKALEALLKVEELSRRALESKRNLAGDKLKQILTAKKARDRYGKGSGESRFIDHGG